MLFGSLFFLTVFLPVALAGHWTLQAAASRIAARRGAARPSAALPNAWLLAANAFFCFYGDPAALALLAASGFANWAAVRRLCRTGRTRGGKVLLAFAVVADLAVLGVFKYAGFFAASANALFGLGLPVPDLWLPLGVSFWTFREISALVDSAKGEGGEVPPPLAFLVWLSLFPVLVSGPIARLRDMDRTLVSRPFSADLAASGMRRFFVGLAKKALVADTLAPLADAAWETAGAGCGLPPDLAALALVAYSLQLYFDFSGYTDMAVGLGRMLGFRIPENFDYPYATRSVREFWRRWHATLGSWLRDYVYIPLGGSRCGLARVCFNNLAVFVLCGLWHGAGATFVAWGAWHGLCVVAERLSPSPAPRGRFGALALDAGRRAWALAAVMLGWAVFRSPDFATARTFLLSLAGAAEVAPASRALWIDFSPKVMAALAFGAVFSFPVVPRVRAALRRAVPDSAAWWLESASAAALALCAAFFLAGSSFRSFLYFKF